MKNLSFSDVFLVPSVTTVSEKEQRSLVTDIGGGLILSLPVLSHPAYSSYETVIAFSQAGGLGVLKEPKDRDTLMKRASIFSSVQPQLGASASDKGGIKWGVEVGLNQDVVKWCLPIEPDLMTVSVRNPNSQELYQHLTWIKSVAPNIPLMVIGYFTPEALSKCVLADVICLSSGAGAFVPPMISSLISLSELKNEIGSEHHLYDCIGVSKYFAAGSRFIMLSEIIKTTREYHKDNNLSCVDVLRWAKEDLTESCYYAGVKSLRELNSEYYVA
jgi:hypothetical protein